MLISVYYTAASLSLKQATKTTLYNWSTVDQFKNLSFSLFNCEV